MSTFETIATVENDGQIHVAGVPFGPGTEVEVSISPKRQAEDASATPDNVALATARDRMKELFLTIKGFRNSPLIPREELYERGSLH